MDVVDNDSDHDEVLDAAITYKIDGTYSSNSSKDRNAWLHQRIHAATDFFKCGMYPWYARMVLCMHST